MGRLYYTHCVVCGKKLTGKQRKYCSACSAPRIHKKKKTTPCEVCGYLSDRGRFCGKQCRETHERKLKNIKKSKGRNFQLDPKSGVWRRMYYDEDGEVVKRGPWLLVLGETVSVDEKLRAIEV